ncbi:hypothetical protein F5X99DRAFT_365168 [Biscogniauxia marginata]|nr:hypothetical protein F5X99DRAFT_365168 [Biscogniauxia marginata]
MLLLLCDVLCCLSWRTRIAASALEDGLRLDDGMGEWTREQDWGSNSHVDVRYICTLGTRLALITYISRQVGIPSGPYFVIYGRLHWRKQTRAAWVGERERERKRESRAFRV